MKKALFFYLLIEVLIFWGCSDLESDCALEVGSRAVIETLQARNIDFTSKNSIVLLNALDSIGDDRYAIWLDITPRFISFDSDQGSKSKSFFNNSRQLMACPGLQSPEFLESINDIKIYAASDSAIALEERTPLEFEYLSGNSFVPFDNLVLLNERLKQDLFLFIRPVNLNLDSLNQFRIEIRSIYNKVYILDTDLVYISDAIN